MKRSELQNKFTEILKMYGYTENEFMQTNSLASVLLSVAENNGMQPPIISNTKLGWAFINEWENENDAI